MLPRLELVISYRLFKFYYWHPSSNCAFNGYRVASLHIIIPCSNNEICLFPLCTKNDAYKNLYNMLFLGGAASFTKALSVLEPPSRVFKVNELTSLCKWALSIKMSVSNFLIVLWPVANSLSDSAVMLQIFSAITLPSAPASASSSSARSCAWTQGYIFNK